MMIISELKEGVIRELFLRLCGGQDDKSVVLTDVIVAKNEIILYIQSGIIHNIHDYLYKRTRYFVGITRKAGSHAHDFNNILTVIRGYAVIIGENRDLKEKKKELSIVISSCERASRLAVRIMDLVKDKPDDSEYQVHDINNLLMREHL